MSWFERALKLLIKAPCKAYAKSPLPHYLLLGAGLYCQQQCSTS